MIAAVVLAAGASTRLGRPKQLLRLGGRSLLGHAVACAAEGGCAPVFVVVGAHAEAVAAEAERHAARVVPCPAWSEGLSASIRAGVEAVEAAASTARAVLLLACDQLRLTPAVVHALRDAYGGEAGRIAACEYGGAPGVPALFDREYFPELGRLHGPGGAKPLLLRHAAHLVCLPWADGEVDVDRPADVPPDQPGSRQ